MRRAIFIVFMLIFSNSGIGQTLPFTRHFVHKQTDNPAAMGAETGVSAAFLGQYRLYGFENAPMSGALQVTAPFGSADAGAARSFGSYYSDGAYSRAGAYSADEEGAKPMAWGVAVKAASMGVRRRYEALAQYSYQISFSAARLSFGAALGADV